MIDASDRLLAVPLDKFATRPALRGAAEVLALTARETSDLVGVAPGIVPRRIGNGLKLGNIPPYEGRGDVVMFLARLHPRKRPLAFVRMAALLAERFSSARFVLIGPDEGEGAAVRDAIAGSGHSEQITWMGAASPERTDELLATAKVYVLPAFDEVFPMSVLEAMRAGTPVVTTDSLGIAADCRAHGAALVTDGSAHQLAAAVASLLDDATLAEEIRIGAGRYLEEQLNIARVAEQLESAYAAAAGNRR
nr:glycosyltransferase [Microbacterium sp. Y20]